MSYTATGAYRANPVFAMLVASAMARSAGHYVPPFHSPEFPRWLLNAASATQFDQLRLRIV